MREPEEIKAAYRRGNLRERLDLFLAYRDLRTELTRIEQEEEATKAGSRSRPAAAKGKSRSPAASRPGGRMARACALLWGRVTAGTCK